MTRFRQPVRIQVRDSEDERRRRPDQGEPPGILFARIGHGQRGMTTTIP
jgi:hypothetical protein